MDYRTDRKQFRFNLRNLDRLAHKWRRWDLLSIRTAPWSQHSKQWNYFLGSWHDHDVLGRLWQHRAVCLPTTLSFGPNGISIQSRSRRPKLQWSALQLIFWSMVFRRVFLLVWNRRWNWLIHWWSKLTTSFPWFVETYARQIKSTRCDWRAGTLVWDDKWHCPWFASGRLIEHGLDRSWMETY